jgi:single-stranded-DNA-specific exonuclease
VISREGEEAFGSGRSIRPFHLLEAVEASSKLFTRYGGHSHACGFSLPSANVEQLRSELDAFARTRLTEADFDPVLDVEAELHLDEVTLGLFQMLSLLEPYGTGNHEPAFIASNVRLIAPPKILKDKHLKLKLKANGNGPQEPRTESGHLRTVFDALGWHMAERLQTAPLLAGDAIDIAFTIGHNDHPEYGGLELELRDFRPCSHTLLPEPVSAAEKSGSHTT